MPQRIRHVRRHPRQVKFHLRVDHANDDTLITGLIAD